MAVGMTLDQAIKEVQQICGWRSDKSAEITAALRYSQDEREKPGSTFPWFLRKSSSAVAFSTVKNTSIYSLPSDFIQDSEEEEGNMFIYSLVGNQQSRTIFVKKQSFENFQKRYYGEWPYVYAQPPDAITDQSNTIQPGVPIDYVLRDTDLILGPAPNGVYQVIWRYWANDAALASGQKNGWLTNAPWCLIGDAASKICADLQNSEGLATAQGIKNMADQNLFRAIINRQESGRRRRLGSRL